MVDTHRVWEESKRVFRSWKGPRAPTTGPSVSQRKRRNPTLMITVTVNGHPAVANFRFLLFSVSGCPKVKCVRDEGVITAKSMRNWLPTAAYGCELAQFLQETFSAVKYLNECLGSIILIVLTSIG
jgi:hypothetical protein